MGGGATQKRRDGGTPLYGSPYGGAAQSVVPVYEMVINDPEFQMKFRPSEYQEMEQGRDEELSQRLLIRAINDILGGKINPQELQRLPDIPPSDKSHTEWFVPIA
jgi:hypothetical protein